MTHQDLKPPASAPQVVHPEWLIRASERIKRDLHRWRFDGSWVWRLPSHEVGVPTLYVFLHSDGTPNQCQLEDGVLTVSLHIVTDDVGRTLVALHDACAAVRASLIRQTSGRPTDG